MSVWSDPHYRSEPLLVTTEYLNYGLKSHSNTLALCDFHIGDYGHFDVPAPIGHFKQNILDGKANVRQVAYKFGQRQDVSFSKRFELLPIPLAGIKAVYSLYQLFWSGKLRLRAEYDELEFKTFFQNTFNAFGPANYTTRITWEAFSSKHLQKWNTRDEREPLYWSQQAEAVRHLIVASGIHSYRKACAKFKSARKPLPSIENKSIFESKNTDWRCYRFKNLTILESKTQSYILLNKDINRLSQLLESTGKILHYFQTYADEDNALSRRLRNAAINIIDLLVDSMQKSDCVSANSICRALDICQFVYLAERAGPLAHRSLAAQRRKAFDGWYDKLLDIPQILAIMRQFRIREAMELVSIRKMLPVPDFCIFSSMNLNYKMHHAPHESIPHSNPEYNLEDFRLYWSHSMVRNYYDRHKHCPGRIRASAERKEWHRMYPDIEPVRIPYREISDIDYEGTFVFSDYNFSEHELRNDKTMAPNRLPRNLESDDLRKYPIWERNQVANLFMNPAMHRLEDLRKQVVANNERFDYVHLTALKPEAKKENGRMFYMANDAQRIMMSEKEANVAEYLVHKAGNSSGISDIELARRMNSISSRKTTPVRKVYVSFDLDKWSPQQNPLLKKMAYDQWGYAFGLSHVKKLLKVQTGSRLAFIKHNVHHEYINPGQDLEGYDAKTNTAMHIEVMAYAINTCRKQGLLQKSAELLALIDDGGMSLEFPLEASDEEIWECILAIEEVYNMVGLRISWDKTFVSEELFMYLNEIYFRGFKVTPGLKAYLRIGKLDDQPAKTIADDLDAIAGEVQGAIKAGTSYQLAYATYVIEVYKVIKRWSRYKVKLTSIHSLMCLFPVALGGIGVRSLLQLATNEAFNPLVSGLGNIKSFCMSYPRNTELVNRLLNTAMKPMQAEAFLRAPKSIRNQCMTLNLQRFTVTMKEWIKANSKNPFILDVLRAADQQQSDDFANRIGNMTEVSSLGLQTMAEMRPDAAIDKLVSKLQRSMTASELLGFRTSLKLAIANRYQAARLVNTFGSSRGVNQISLAR